MKLFEMKNWELTVREEAWGLAPFAKLLKRDRTKDKTNALKDMLFVWHYSDIKSDFQYITDPEERIKVIKGEIGLNASWKFDKDIEAATKCYEQHSATVIEKLYTQTLKAASAIGMYLSNTDKLLVERDAQGKVVTDIAKITASVQKVPKLMADLKAAYKEVVKEQEDMDNRKKGSKTMNTFEDGLTI
jgi:hypothetical protein